MTAVPRTLPIRVAPIPGEALDSWCETVAARLATPLGDVLRHFGLQMRDTRGAKGQLRGENYDWTLLLHARESAAIAEATGIDTARVHAMTLAWYDGRAVVIDRDTGLVNRSAIWGRGRGSRFCPQCLAASNGRWKLTWRLGWSFACLEHRQLLVDLCPGCQTIQRRRRISRYTIPEPGRCGNRGTGKGSRACCGYDLSQTPALALSDGHPALKAQQAVLQAIETDTANFGAYQDCPQPAAGMLSDLRALAMWIFSLPDEALAEMLPSGFGPPHLTVTRSARADRDNTARTGFMAPPTAETTAIGAVAAMQILGQPSIAKAGARMAELIATLHSAGAQLSTRGPGEWGRYSGSPVLRAVYLSAIGPALRPGFQLRYRTVHAMPCDPAADGPARAARVPSMLWPSWTLRLSPQAGMHHQTLQAALAAALLMVGSNLEQDQAAKLLGLDISGRSISPVFQALQVLPNWRSVQIGLGRLADYLDRYGAPIDYARRRSLSYDSLLPEDQWRSIAREASVLPGAGRRGKVARSVLFQRLSGQPAHQAPPCALEDDYQFAIETDRFAKVQTPELFAGLDEAAQCFLSNHGIAGEPTSWQPPLRLLSDLDLPGPDLAKIDLVRLHDLIRNQDLSVRHAAETLCTSVDAAQRLLEQEPAPARGRKRRSDYGTGSVSSAARDALPIATFRRLYEDERKSVPEICRSTGFSRPTLRRLMREYGITARPLGEASRRLDPVKHEWLYEQYVTHRRPLTELAAEKGMSVMNMSRWAHIHGIPLRGPGGASHRRYLHRNEEKLPGGTTPTA